MQELLKPGTSCKSYFCSNQIYRVGSKIRDYFAVVDIVSKLYFCQTPLQLVNPTQLQLVGEGVDFVFPLEEEEEEKTPPRF